MWYLTEWNLWIKTYMVGISFTSSFPGAQGSYYNPETPGIGKGFINTGWRMEKGGGDRLRGWVLWPLLSGMYHIAHLFSLSLILYFELCPKFRSRKGSPRDGIQCKNKESLIKLTQTSLSSSSSRPGERPPAALDKGQGVGAQGRMGGCPRLLSTRTELIGSLGSRELQHCSFST